MTLIEPSEGDTGLNLCPATSGVHQFVLGQTEHYEGRPYEGVFYCGACLGFAIKPWPLLEDRQEP